MIVGVKPANSHGFPIIDGRFTGDWCAPGFVGSSGPDSFITLSPPDCPIGTEFFWDDWDANNYGVGTADTMGWLAGGGLGSPLTDQEVDIDFFATTSDINSVYFAVGLGIFPSTTSIPPHIQIAIDVDGPSSGNLLWYDPLAAGYGGIGLYSANIPDYLVTTDVLAGIAFVWESNSNPGIWTLVGLTPLGWSGYTVLPGVIEIGAPWSMFSQGPTFEPGVPVHLTIMSAHSAPFASLSDAPISPEDDILTESGAGFTTSPDPCPSGPSSADCELFLGPGGGGGSADAFISITYPAESTIFFPLVSR